MSISRNHRQPSTRARAVMPLSPSLNLTHVLRKDERDFYDKLPHSVKQSSACLAAQAWDCNEPTWLTRCALRA